MMELCCSLGGWRGAPEHHNLNVSISSRSCRGCSAKAVKTPFLAFDSGSCESTYQRCRASTCWKRTWCGHRHDDRPQGTILRATARTVIPITSLPSCCMKSEVNAPINVAGMSVTLTAMRNMGSASAAQEKLFRSTPYATSSGKGFPDRGHVRMFTNLLRAGATALCLRCFLCCSSDCACYFWNDTKGSWRYLRDMSCVLEQFHCMVLECKLIAPPMQAWPARRRRRRPRRSEAPSPSAPPNLVLVYIPHARRH